MEEIDFFFNQCKERKGKTNLRNFPTSPAGPKTAEGRASPGFGHGESLPTKVFERGSAAGPHSPWTGQVNGRPSKLTRCHSRSGPPLAPRRHPSPAQPSAPSNTRRDSGWMHPSPAAPSQPLSPVPAHTRAPPAGGHTSVPQLSRFPPSPATRPLPRGGPHLPPAPGGTGPTLPALRSFPSTTPAPRFQGRRGVALQRPTTTSGKGTDLATESPASPRSQ